MSDALDLAIGKPNINAIHYNFVLNRKPLSPIEICYYCYCSPILKVATYTRFVLPFAFHLESITEITKSDSLFYRVSKKIDLPYIKRKKYFTRETADTLYERGQWLTMCENWMQTTWGKAEIEVRLREQVLKIGMLPPQLVLFELPEIREQKEPNLLQTGFLYVDIYFPEQEHPPQLDDLLVLNEFFRYFGMPYDDHAKKFKKKFSNVPVCADKTKTIASLGKLECYFERWASMLERPIKHKNQYYQLFPQSWGMAARQWMYNIPNSHQADH